MVQAGDVLSGRYELVERLGRGGMAEVFRATDRSLHREIAVKVLSPDRARDEGFIARFQREARSAASLNHRNVVGVHDTGEDNGAHYIVMELVDGPTLEEVIRRDGPIEPTRAIAIAQGICTALEAAHARGLVHRDVKPGNIMFDAEGAVKVADFGLARAAVEATETQNVYGSAPYMSPEQARAENVDARSDIYALGCVLYAMVTGRPPFDGDAPLAIVYQHLHGRPTPPSEIVAGIPPGLEQVILRALRKNPDDRYQDVAALHENLNRVATGKAPLAADADRTRVLGETAPTVAVGAGGAPARPANRPARAAPRSVRKGSRSTGIALLFVAALVAIFAALFLLAEDPPAPEPAPPEQVEPEPEPEPAPPDDAEDPGPPEEAPDEEEEEEEEEEEPPPEEEEEEEDGDAGLPLPRIGG